MTPFESMDVSKHPANEVFRRLGYRCWPNIYEGAADDHQAHENLLRWADLAPTEQWRDFMTRADGRALMLWSARWVDQGCPRIVIDSKYAALLMATDVGVADAATVVAPWKAFLIELPFDWLGCTDPMTGIFVGITRVLVQVFTLKDVAVWNIGSAPDPARWVAWSDGLTAHELLLRNEAALLRSAPKYTNARQRLDVVLARLVASACLAMSDPANLRKQKTSHGRGSRPSLARTPGMPDIQTYVLGKPLQINCRQAIVDYLEGNTTSRNSPTVQTLVRGHWKHQPYGPGLTARKLIHIEPYWRGPDGAPILIRPTHLSRGAQ